jgi:predicted nucleic acid-binding protein
MAVAILDTSIYIDHWERGLYQETLESLRRAYIIRHSAVVLSELRRGARGREAERLVASLFELATVRWEPSVADWWEAGRLIRNIGDYEDWDINKRRDFQNDALIALTARRHGATVVTANSSEFELLRRNWEFRFLRLDEGNSQNGK